VLILLCAAASSPSPATPKPAEQPAKMVAGLPPEVRIRKLHLVRPDLIPYPIAMEVVC